MFQIPQTKRIPGKNNPYQVDSDHLGNTINKLEDKAAVISKQMSEKILTQLEAMPPILFFTALKCQEKFYVI